MEPGQHKKKINYTVMIVSDSPDGGLHPFYLKQKAVTFLLALLVLIVAALIAAVGFAARHSAALEKEQGREAELQQQISTLTEENQRLSAENSELSDKVKILSNTVNQNAETAKALEQEEEEKKVPSAFPLAGPAIILESSETPKAGEEEQAGGETQEKEPIVVFSASAGTNVVAAAQGVVALVEADETYGYRVVVDHENGYTSIYRAQSEPKVSEGDTVMPGQTLYEMQTADEKLGYQITENDVLIDPLDLLELYG